MQIIYDSDERCRDSTGKVCTGCGGATKTGMNGCFQTYHPVPGEMLNIQSSVKAKERYENIKRYL